MSVIARRLAITGRVQGVGYRDSMRRVAESLAVSGWVRNRVDGSVDALLQGSREAVERVIEWARRGPPAARVAGVVVADEPVSALSGFALRPTL